MPGGPIFPYSMRPITAPRVFPAWYAGTNADMETLGFEASLGADAIWRCWYKMPPTLPTGTMKMALAGISAGAGNMRINVKWKSFGAAEALTSPSLNAEGAVTITTVANQLIENKVTMDADTPVAGEYVIADITGETASWTLASVSGLLVPIIWE